MNYTYKIRRARPKERYISVVYSSDQMDLPDYTKNFVTDDFTPENVENLIRTFAPRVREFWEYYESQPDSDGSLINENFTGSDTAIKTITLDQPAFNPATQKIEEQVTFDSDTQINVISWNVVPLSNEEQIDYDINKTFERNKSVENQSKALELLVQKNVVLDDLSDEELGIVSQVYTPWTIDEDVKIDTIRQYDGVIYKAVQAHTTSYLWPPPITPALWTPVRQPLAPWVQPTGAQDAYDTGARVTHDNPNDGGNIWVYESTIDANTTEPGRDGTFDQWWTPINPV